jgi:hypothetical protein
MARVIPDDPYQSDTHQTPEQLHGAQQQQRYEPVNDDSHEMYRDLSSAQLEALEERFGPQGSRSETDRLQTGDKYDEGTSSDAERRSLDRANDIAGDSPNPPKNGFFRNEDTNDAGGTSVNASPKGGSIRRFFWSNNKRKAATLAGTSGLLSVGIAIISFLGLGSGPLQFVHIAKILTGPLSSLGHVNAASDYRMAKFLYQVYRTGDLSSLDAGDTRIGKVGIFLKKPVLQALEDRGITPQYGKFKSFEGFTLDITNDRSPYRELSPDDAMAKLQEDLAGGKKLKFTFADAEKTKIFVSGEGFTGDATAIKATSAIIAKTYDNWLFGKVAAAINTRFMTKYTQAGFHPLQKSVRSVSDWWDARVTRMKTGVQPADINTQGAKEETTQNGKKVVTDAPGESGPATSEGIKAKLEAVKGPLGLAGAAATIVAIICLLQAIDHNIGAIRYAQVMVPMIREGMDAISVGNQIMTNQDVDMAQVNKLASQFNTVDPVTHRPSSTWSSAAAIESLSGGYGGTELNPQIKDMFSGPPAALKWTENQAVTTLCGQTAQVVVGVASVAIGLFSGEVASTAAGLLAGALVGPAIIDFISNLLAGATINPDTLSGAQWGNVIAYGARLAGNAQALQYGGVALTNQQVAELNQSTDAQSRSEFHSQTLADRIFNPYDYRSVVGSAIDQINISGGAGGVLAAITDLPSLFGNILKTPLNLFGAITHAAPAAYQYPFPEFGFSQADLTNPAVDDPVANAKVVGNLLDHNNTNGEPDYIQAGLNCWGVSITKGPDGWDAVPSTDEPSSEAFKQDRTQGVDAYDAGTYNQGACIKNNDLNWLRFRMWIYDTRLANGYACYMGDQTSCANDSFGDNPASAVTPNAGSNIIWLNSGPGTPEFDSVCDGCKDPKSGATAFWVSSQCSQASLAEVLNAYHMGQKLAAANDPHKPSATGSDPLYKIIDVERLSYAAGVWGDAGLIFKPTAEDSWRTEAGLFNMNATIYSSTLQKTDDKYLDNSSPQALQSSLDKIIAVANKGQPVITNAPNHWLVIWGGDQNYVYVLDSSINDYTYAKESTRDGVTMDGPHGQPTKVSRKDFISGLTGTSSYWGADNNGNNPSPIAVVLSPNQ